MNAYLHTRVSLFASRLWQPQDFSALMTAEPAAVPALLAAHDLPQLAVGYDPAQISQDILSLEQRIIAQLLQETHVLIRPLRGAARAFLQYWTARFEITNVKSLLRGKIKGERPAVLLGRLTPMGSFGQLDVEALAHAEDVPELLRRLESGSYAGIVRQARQALEQHQDPFMLDAALDRGYYEGLVHRALAAMKDDAVGKAEAGHGVAGQPVAAKSLPHMLVSLVDRINLVWLLRYRFNYQLPPAQVYYLLVSAPAGLTPRRLHALATLPDMDSVLAALPEPLRQRLQGAADISEVFARMERAAAVEATQVLRAPGQQHAPALMRAFAFLLLRERELRAVRAVLRGRQLNLPAALIEQTVLASHALH